MTGEIAGEIAALKKELRRAERLLRPFAATGAAIPADAKKGWVNLSVPIQLRDLRAAAAYFSKRD